jgi:hypothetical protein
MDDPPETLAYQWYVPYILPLFILEQSFDVSKSLNRGPNPFQVFGAPKDRLIVQTYNS